MPASAVVMRGVMELTNANDATVTVMVTCLLVALCMDPLFYFFEVSRGLLQGLHERVRLCCSPSGIACRLRWSAMMTVMVRGDDGVRKRYYGG